MRRISLFLLIALFLTGMSAAVFAGAQGEEATEGGEAEAVTVTLSDWHMAEPHWEKALNEMKGMFEEEHPNITIELETVSYGEKETKYTTEIQAGKGPDVFHLHGYSVKTFIEKDLAKDLTPFLEGESSGFLDANYDITLDIMKHEGSYYAIPGDFMSMVLYYNARLFEEAGLDPNQPPETWEEFLSYAQQLTRDTNDDGQIDTWGFGTIGAVTPGFELRFTPILFSHGGRYLNDENTYSMLHTEEAKEAFRYFTGLVSEEGVVPPGVTSQNAGTVRQQMAYEQVAMILGSGWTPPIVESNNPDIDWQKYLKIAPVPTASGYDGQYTTTAWISAWLMNPNTENAEAAWEVMKYITSKEIEQKWFDDARVLSSRKDVSEEYQPLLDDKYAKVIADQLSHSKFVPQVKEWPQIIEAVNAAAQEAMTGAKSPDQALKGAHQRINDILSVYRDSDENVPSF